MRSRELVLFLALACAGAAGAAEPPTPSRAQVEQAMADVRRHPDLGGKQREKKLQLRPGDRKADPRQQKDPELQWLVDFLRWLSDASRAIVWILGGVAVALVLVGLRRWMQVRGGLLPAARPELPSHVQSLDIRPASLPPDIGAAAARLWERGEHRQALSLLYRGALSRLVHGHAVPIRAASTEGECVALARSRLEPGRGDFFARLVGAWQLAVYGGRMPAHEQALALCHEFDRQLPAAAPEAAA